MYSLFATTNNNSNSNSKRSDDENVGLLLQQEQELEYLEQAIVKYNHNKPLNVNSPKQVSLAIFGTVQSTSRQVLEHASRGGEGGGGVQQYNQRQAKLAQLVLQHRALTSSRTRGRGSSQQRTSSSSQHEKEAHLSPSTFSTLATTTTTTNTTTTTTSSSNDSPQSDNDVIVEEEVLTVVGGRDASNGRQKAQRGLVEVHYEQYVNALFGDDNNHKTAARRRGGSGSDNSILNVFWKEALLCLTKPSARNMVLQLNPNNACPMGYDPAASPNTVVTTTTSDAGKKGSLLYQVRREKEKYADCIILTRVGEFYETYGLDAVLLVEHCGLNAMAGKARAGCPVRNIQATLDCLTSKGFRVAVYEEATDTDSSRGTGASAGPKSRLKNRMLAQIVSPASPTYLFDLVLAGNADALVSSPVSRPYVGILESAAGYTLVQVSVEEQSVRISERLTAEAVACHLAAFPPADPLLYVPLSMASGTTTTTSGTTAKLKALPFLPSRSDAASDGPGSRHLLKVLPASLVEEPSPGVSDIERARRTIVGALLQMMDRHDEHVAKVDDYVIVGASLSDRATNDTQTNPLYVETASQLGLMNDKTIPPLVSYLLPDSAPAASRRFLRRWLLTPPLPHVADAMSDLVTFLKDCGPALPALSVPTIGKVLALLRAGQASAQVYGELLAAMDATIAILGDTLNLDNREDVICPLMTLLEHESGIAADPASLRGRCIDAIHVIEDVISPIHHVGNTIHDANDFASDYGDLIPRAFFERNEAPWRGRVQSTAAQESYELVGRTAETLARAVAVDYWGFEKSSSMDDIRQKASKRKSPIVQDIFNNIFALKEVPSWLDKSDDVAKLNYFHPRDRNGKLLRNRYTSADVQSALSDYVAACDRACLEVSSVLTGLSQTLCESGHLPAIVQAAHANLILSTAANHAANANALGWNSAVTYEPESGRKAGHFQDVWPYWMDRSEAVTNSFDMDGLFLLTAPNMSGKSTLMRSTAAASLLANCGLCAPLGPGSMVQRFDNIFVRGASADVPTEGKSAFGAEMGDIAALLRSCGDKSLVFVDELGRGTSPKDGTCLAGAVLEAMADAGMSGIFATHLHDVLDLPLNGRDSISMKRMAFEERENGNGSFEYVWTYMMQDGFCTNSLALVTAAKFGLPDAILQRAQFFGKSLPVSSLQNSNDVSDHDFQGHHSYINGESSSSNTSLERAIRVAEELIGQEGTVIRIPPMWMSPPSLEGCSCVYILELGNEHPRKYYVGETDSLHRRLGQHRAKGGEWSLSTAAALPISRGKTRARVVESLLIRKLAKAGFTMESISDGRLIRSSNSVRQKNS